MKLISIVWRFVFPAWHDATQADLHKPCRMRNGDDEQWQCGVLVGIASSNQFACYYEIASWTAEMTERYTGHFKQCQVR